MSLIPHKETQKVLTYHNSDDGRRSRKVQESKMTKFAGFSKTRKQTAEEIVKPTVGRATHKRSR
jgi:hypothetical protein